MINLRDSDGLIPFILPQDSAVDAKKSNIKKYVETMDPKYLVLKDGGAPTVWKIRRLTGDQFRHAKRQSNPTDYAVELVAYGLSSVENFDRPITTERSDLGDRLTKESLEPLILSELIYELAAAVKNLGGLHPLGR